MTKNANRQLIYVPIEPLKERYTEEWYHGLRNAFTDRGYRVVTIDGTTLVDTIQVGTFLDINSTTHYKFTQLQKISEMFYKGQVEPNAIFWFSDLEFWGLESVRLMSQLNGVPIKIAAFLHAASYTIDDAFSVAAPYQQFTELGWIAATDRVFVGSNYHKQAVYERRMLHCPELVQKIHVTGNPLFYEYMTDCTSVEKVNQIILPNRLDIGKNSTASLTAVSQILERYPSWSAVITSGRSELRGTDSAAVALAESMAATGKLRIVVNAAKQQYHTELARSKLMFSHSYEESYGICIAESLYYGTQPVLADYASHPEFRSAIIFQNNHDLINKITPILETGNVPPLTRRESGLPQILEILETL